MRVEPSTRGSLDHVVAGFAVLAALLCSSLAFAASGAGPTSLNISGGLFSSNGQPILQSGVNFKIEILDKAATCVLYREVHVGEDLSSTKGGFSLLIGQGSSIQNLVGGGVGMMTSKVFENPGTAQIFSGCGGVTLNSGDERLIRVYYDTGGGYTAMTPDVPVSVMGCPVAPTGKTADA